MGRVFHPDVGIRGREAPVDLGAQGVTAFLVGVELVHRQDDFVGVGMADIDWVSEQPGPVLMDAMHGDSQLSRTRQTLAGTENVGDPIADLLVVVSFGRTWLGR